jgi:hypothetical protein
MDQHAFSGKKSYFQDMFTDTATDSKLRPLLSIQKLG